MTRRAVISPPRRSRDVGRVWWRGGGQVSRDKGGQEGGNSPDAPPRCGIVVASRRRRARAANGRVVGRGLSYARAVARREIPSTLGGSPSCHARAVGRVVTPTRSKEGRKNGASLCPVPVRDHTNRQPPHRPQSSSRRCRGLNRSPVCRSRRRPAASARTPSPKRSRRTTRRNAPRRARRGVAVVGASAARGFVGRWRRLRRARGQEIGLDARRDLTPSRALSLSLSRTSRLASVALVQMVKCNAIQCEVM